MHVTKKVSVGVQPARPTLHAGNGRPLPARASLPALASPLKSTQAEVLSTNDDDIQAMALLAEEDMGLLVSRTGEMGRGLMAERPVLKQVLLSIPMRNALVVTDNPLENISVYGDTMVDEWMETHGALPPNLLDLIRGDQRWDVRLTAWLLWLLDTEGSRQRPAWAADAPAGLWDVYLRHLPHERDVSCLLAYGKEAGELQIKRLMEEASIQHEWIEHLHERWFSRRQSGGPRSLKETVWASAMVRSRTFSEEVNGESLTLMVPWADLANHSVSYNSTFGLSKDKESFELRSLRPLAAGEEALISYGDNKTNPELMRDYGFVVPGNPWDRIPVLPGADLLAYDSIAQESAPRPEYQGPCLNGASLCESSDMEGDWMRGELQAIQECLPTVKDEADWERRRCALLSLPLTDGLQGYGGACGTPPGPTPPPRKLKASEVRDERAAIAHYREHLSQLTAVLPTTIATDIQLLQEGNTGRGKSGLTARHMQAVRCRLEYKRLVRQGVEMLARYDALLADSVRLPQGGL